MGVRFWDRNDVPEKGGVTWCDFYKICRLVISIFIFVSTMRKQTFEAQGVSPWIRVPQRLFRGFLRQADDASPGAGLPDKGKHTPGFPGKRIHLVCGGGIDCCLSSKKSFFEKTYISYTRHRKVLCRLALSGVGLGVGFHARV